MIPRHLVQRTACVGVAIAPNRRLGYWKARLTFLRRRLRLSGLAACEVEEEIAHFASQVREEARRLQHGAAPSAISPSAPAAILVAVRGIVLTRSRGGDGRHRPAGDPAPSGPSGGFSDSRGSGAAQYLSKNPASVAQVPIPEAEMTDP